MEVPVSLCSAGGGCDVAADGNCSTWPDSNLPGSELPADGRNWLRWSWVTCDDWCSSFHVSSNHSDRAVVVQLTAQRKDSTPGQLL